MFANMTKEQLINRIKSAIDSVCGCDCAYHDLDGFAIANAIYDLILTFEDSPKLHVLKIAPKYFEEIRMGFKKFECRYNDRNYKNGDYLLLKEFYSVSNKFTGRILFCKVTSVLDDENYVKESYIVMSIEVLNV